MRTIALNARATLAFTLALAACGPAYAGLTINLSYDATVTALADNAAIQAATRYAADQFQNLFSDNITINIKVVAATTGFGSSFTPFNPIPYSDIYTAFGANAATSPSADKTTALGAGGSIPAADPVATTHDWWVPRAEQKVLGLLGTPNDLVNDGTFTFNQNAGGAGTGWSYLTGTSRTPGGTQYDFVGVAEHEIAEMMGAISLLGATIGGGPGYLPFDLFRYTGAGARNMTDGNNIFFSLNNGTTLLKQYNFPNGNGSDPQDWASGTPSNARNAFGGPGQQSDFAGMDGNVNVRTLTVLGYTPVPEPATTGALAAGFLALIIFTQRLFWRRTEA